jgi:hypothetical protein
VSIELIAIYCHSFEIFIIQIGEMAFYKPEFIIIKSNYFQNAQKGECFLDDFEALVRERRFGALCGHLEGSEFKIVICTSISRPRNHSLRYREKKRCRGRLRPRHTISRSTQCLI